MVCKHGLMINGLQNK